MISSDSRYADSVTVNAQNRKGKDIVVITPSRSNAFTFNYVNYVLNSGDRVDLLANAFYNDPTLWWKIADANPEIMDWTFLPAGKTIRIPNA